MQYLSLDQIEELHRGLIETSGGSQGIRDKNGFESAVAQPQSAFGGHELYPSIADKACAIAYSLIKNHPFLDGNKRIGYAAMAVFVRMNGYRLVAEVDDAECITLGIAAGKNTREEFRDWIRDHLIELDS